MNKRSYPAYSMGVRSKMHTQQVVPGPGAYNPSSTHYSPSHKIGRSQRRFQSNRISPGPGSYSVNNISHSNQVVMTSKPLDHSGILTPGPGSYDPKFQKIQRKMPQYSIKNSTLFFNSIKTPGPGQYNINTKVVFKSPGRAIFGTQAKLNRKKFIRNTPGPGTYDYQNSKDYFQHQKYGTIGKQSRSSNPNTFIPGPGEYNLKSLIQYNLQKKRGYHIGIKTHCITETCTPGPGEYHQKIQQILKKNPSYSLERAKRKFNEDNKHTPAPGSYKYHQSTFNKTGTIIGKQRKDKRNTQPFPGPGAYDLPSYISNLPFYNRSKSVIFKK